MIIGGDTLRGVFSEWSWCTECMEVTHDGDPERQHAPGCSRRPAPRPSVARSRTHDPNVYVWTANGIERATDVERRRRAA